MNNIPGIGYRHLGLVDDALERNIATRIPLFNLDSMFNNETTQVLDESGDYLAAIYRCPIAGGIEKLGCYIYSKTGSPRYTIRLETVAAPDTGKKHPKPSGTIWATNTTGNFTPSSTGWTWVTLTASATVAVNDLIAVVLFGQAKYVSTSNYCTFVQGANTHTAIYRGFPFPLFLQGVEEGETE